MQKISKPIQNAFIVKGRPRNHPLIVHLANSEQLEEWAINIPEMAKILAKHFWPGPLTLILDRHPKVSKLITGGQDTIALRVPNHPLTLMMLKQFNSGIVGPSANSYGKISPTTASHVQKDLGDKVNYILDGGQCGIGIESTIVSFIENNLQVLRKGNITEQDLRRVLVNNIAINKHKTIPIRVPGTTESHYAPTKPTFLVQSKSLPEIIRALSEKSLNYCYLSFQSVPGQKEETFWLQGSTNAKLYAKDLYCYLHQLDATNSKGIIIEEPHMTLEWEAIIDRLIRASNGYIDMTNLLEKLKICPN